MRLIPDVLQSGDEFYFPIFSTVEAMGEYGESFSKVQHSVLKAISMAKNNEKNISGLVLNALLNRSFSTRIFGMLLRKWNLRFDFLTSKP